MVAINLSRNDTFGYIYFFFVIDNYSSSNPFESISKSLESTESNSIFRVKYVSPKYTPFKQISY